MRVLKVRWKTTKTDHVFLIKDQTELVKMWNTAIFIKKSMGRIRKRLDTAKEVYEQQM